jgi:hypothetical protein
MNRSMLSLAATVLLTLTAHTGFAEEPARIPLTTHAAASSDLVARADRALHAYVAACSSGDDEALGRIVTSDAVVEYALEEPRNLPRGRGGRADGQLLGQCRGYEKGGHISNLWIFPTNDSNVVFVQYTIDSDVRTPAQLPDSEHLAVLEMRGDRIVKMRNFTGDTSNPYNTRDIRG